jgi:hypothetical protein
MKQTNNNIAKSLILKYLPWILLAIILFYKGCSGSDSKPQKIKVIVPKVKGVFKPKKPEHKVLIETDTVFKNNPINKKLIAENQKLKADFAKANDSIKQLSFNNAIELKTFNSDFEDEFVKISIDGIVQGEVKEFKPSYTIKERELTVSVKQKETVLRVLAGGSLGFNKAMNKAVYGFDLGFQNRKGNIITAEYLKVGTFEFASIGFKKSILTVKR